MYSIIFGTEELDHLFITRNLYNYIVVKVKFDLNNLACIHK